MVLVVQVRNSLTKRTDAGGGTVLAARDGDIQRLRPLETPLDIILNFRSALAQIGPLIGLLQEAELGSTLRAPNDTCRSTCGIEAGMRQMAFVGGAELAMDLAAGL